MDFNQIRYFLALTDSLNFSRAAEQCFVSQPALTQAIKRLESELGGELINRDGVNTQLTELGKSLRGHFDQIERTRHLVKNTAKAITTGEIAELNIGIMCTIGSRLISGMLLEFKMLYPKVTVVLHDITSESIPSMLLSGTLDSVFCTHRGSPHPDLHFIDLYEEAMIIAFPQNHEFAQLDVVPLKEVARQPYIDRLHCEFRQEISEFYDDHNLETNISCQSQREDWIQDLIREGIGVSVIPQYSLLHSDIDYRSIVDPVLSRAIKLATADQTQSSPAQNSFIELAQNYTWCN